MNKILAVLAGGLLIGAFAAANAELAPPTPQEKAAAALKTYSDAETDEQRTAAEKDLQDAVSEQFEVLMKSREAQIEELKARLGKLTEQLQKRRDAKDQIVTLRVQVLVNEAQGLGFYPEGASAWPAMGYGQMYEGLYGTPAYPAATAPRRTSPRRTHEGEAPDR